MNKIFSIPCYNAFEKSFIVDCVESIKDYNPDSLVQIIDSGSPDKSYIDKVEKFDRVSVSEEDNKAYAFGAYWKGYLYEVHQQQSLFICLHDSTIVRSDFSDDIFHNQLFTPFWYWKDLTLVPGGNTYEWTKEQIEKHTKYTKLSEYCIYGGCFVTHGSFMAKLFTDGLFKCLPHDKQSSANADEHLWATACLNNGIRVEECAVVGDCNAGLNTEDAPIWKFAGHKFRS